jgi:carboxyl-terminal processing protease
MLKKHLISLALVGMLSGIISCKKLTDVYPKDQDPVPVENNPNAEVNSWIFDEMKTYYLWEGQMAEKAKTDNKLAADAYFESILVKPGELDRFSWIQEDVEELTASLNGINKVLGIRTAPFYANAAKTKLALAIAYALKGSPAEKAGIKRGDFITKVNGVELTPENYSTALQPENLKLTMGSYTNGEIVSNSTELAVTKVEHQTNPIQHASVLTVGTKKIGVLVYLQFLSQYDNDIRNVFKDFKAQGINELVLDLRYNGGGYISSANIISSLIVKDLKAGTLMSRQEWNTQLTAEFKKQYGANVFDTNWLSETNNLGSLNRVYILTSNGTASASELVINNLKPFMDVILIGGNTYGKNVGSITLSDDKKRWKWGMQPIVLRTVNAKGESDYGTKEGFSPTIKATDNVVPFKPFGDPEETYLKLAIEHITGKPVVASASNAKKAAPKVVQLLNTSYPLDNPKTELRDMWIDKLPGQR